MDSLESIVHEIDDIERQFSRRGFIKFAALALVVAPRITPDADDREFVRKVAATLIPAGAIEATGIDVFANVEHMMRQGSAVHRQKVLRFLTWARRVSFVYGGERVAINERGSRFVLVQKMSRALSSLCLAAFWADERALALIEPPQQKP